ncbi:MAG: hypothetical protein PHF50_01265 [Patescibacteria group bacterium]|nr:hypothetical protein [Candidatus Saccharimonadaceae bacterium]MDD4271413.1 hypothetical protein [Patescibacteria group bacterium]
MKKMMLMSSVLAVLFLFIGQAYAQITGLPSSNALIKGGWAGDVTVKVDKTNGTATIEVTLPPAQSGAIVLYRSIAHASNNAWMQGGQKELTTIMSADQALANLELGKGIYRVRLWGKVGVNWLSVNQASKYYRLDAGKNPAYEFIVNTDTGEVIPVPNDYPAWN